MYAGKSLFSEVLDVKNYFLPRFSNKMIFLKLAVAFLVSFEKANLHHFKINPKKAKKI